MPLPASAGSALLPTNTPLVQTRTGIATQVWLGWFRSTQGSIESLNASIAGTLATVLQDTHANRLAAYPQINYDPGTLFYETDRGVFYIVNPGNTAWDYASGEMADTFANVPTDLGADDAGFLLQITDYGHRVKWSGTAWDFAPGDPGNAYFQDFAVAPSTGWKLCDGTATTYLTMGATISATAFTTPNLSGSPAYRKSAAAYTGTIAAAVAPGLSGDTGSTAPGISGSTANANATISGQTASATDTITTGGPNQTATSVAYSAGSGTLPASPTHDHTGTTDGHLHGVGTLAVDNHLHAKGTLAVDSHLHGVGTLAADATGEPARLGVLPFFRR